MIALGKHSKNMASPKSRTSRGKFITFLCVLLGITLVSCDSNIDGGKINIDDTTKIYTYKKDGTAVTGTVVFYELDSKTAKKYKSSIREVKNGKRINKGYDYYPNGVILAECQYDENGLVTGEIKYFFKNGKLSKTAEFKEDKQDGIAKEFDNSGDQVKEIIFEAGKKVKEYDFKNGEKIVPAIEKLELVQYKTGFYEYKNLTHNELLYQPMVIMKWKNVSNESLDETIKIEGIFIDNKKGEEWSKSLDYFQGYSDTPLQVGLSRQSSLQSSVGFTSYWGISGANISCQILINGQLYKTVKIKNEYLSSNRIQ
jgi:antitoxin component YwqK of YwqJK toxin-antitoxin module